MIVLIPYFAGNGVHGHAAKLWSNRSGALLVWDDHTAQTAVKISGRARIRHHPEIARAFPDIAAQIGARKRRNGAPAEDPEYWFEQDVEEIVQLDEALPRNALHPVREACSIHAGGLALHGKKPAYFAGDSLPTYDMRWQHEREAAGRPTDPSGVSRRYWEWEATPFIAERRAHLAQIGAD